MKPNDFFAALDAKRIDFLEKMSSDYVKFTWFINFLNEVGKNQWEQKQQLAARGSYKKLNKVLNDRKKDFGIATTDLKWKAVDNWIAHVFPFIAIDRYVAF